MPERPHAADPPLFVACLCAQWCGTCRDYRAVFEAALQHLGADARSAWVDIEDEAAAVGAVDVDDFPTLLIARGDRPLFFGPLTPQPGTLARLLAHAQAGALAPDRALDAEVQALCARLRDLPTR